MTGEKEGGPVKRNRLKSLPHDAANMKSIFSSGHQPEEHRMRSAL